jgi:hypothetical protein
MRGGFARSLLRGEDLAPNNVQYKTTVPAACLLGVLAQPEMEK